MVEDRVMLRVGVGDTVRIKICGRVRARFLGRVSGRLRLVWFRIWNAKS